MKVRVERTELAEALKWANSTVGNGFVSATNGMILDAQEGKLTVKTTDLDTSAVVSIPAAIDEPGTVLAPRRIVATVGKLPDQPVELHADDRLTVRCGRVETTAALMQADDFPALPEVDGEPIMLGADVVDRVGKQVAACVAKRPGDTPFLMGVRCTVGDGKATFVGTDRYRVQMLTVDVDGQGEGTVPPGLFSSDGSRAGLVLADTMVSLEADGRTVVSALMEGAFPNVPGMWPTGEPVEVTVDRDGLLASLDRVQALTGRDSDKHFPQVRLAVDGDLMTLVGEQDGDQIADALDVFATDQWDVVVNPTFLAGLVKAHRSEQVTLGQTGRNKPVTVGSDDSQLSSLLMPVSVKRQ